MPKGAMQPNAKGQRQDGFIQLHGMDWPGLQGPGRDKAERFMLAESAGFWRETYTERKPWAGEHGKGLHLPGVDGVPCLRQLGGLDAHVAPTTSPEKAPDTSKCEAEGQ